MNTIDNVISGINSFYDHAKLFLAMVYFYLKELNQGMFAFVLITFFIFGKTQLTVVQNLFNANPDNFFTENSRVNELSSSVGWISDFFFNRKTEFSKNNFKTGASENSDHVVFNVDSTSNFSKHKNNHSAIILSGPSKFIKPTATGNGSGSDWDNAAGAASIKTIIESGGTVYIAEGSYPLTASVDIENRVCVQGGFPSASTGTDISQYNPVTYPTIIDGQGSTRIFDNKTTVDTLELKGLVLQNGSAPVAGGSAFKSEHASSIALNYRFIDLLVKDNATSTRATFLIEHKSSPNAKILFQNCLFDNNTPTRTGAIYINLVNNNATANTPNPGNLVIEDCAFTNNTALITGAIHFENSDQWTIRRSSFCGNATTLLDGGAISSWQCEVIDIIDSDFSGNIAVDEGGAFYIGRTDLNINGCTFDSNRAANDEQGGAIYGYDNSGLELINSTFYNNQAGVGGAVYWNGTYLNLGNPNTIANCIFDSNHGVRVLANSLGGGGAIKLFRAHTNISNSQFVGNTIETTSFGGAINNNESHVALTNSLFYDNLKGTSNNIFGADIANYTNSGGGSFSPMSGNKMQLSGPAIYVNVNGAPVNPDTYNFTNDTFNNTDNAGLPNPITIECPTSLPLNNVCNYTINATAVTGVSCLGFHDGSIDLTVTGGVSPYAYAWSNFATTEDITNLAPGDYTVTITDANTCPFDFTFTVTTPTVLLSVDIDSTSNYNGSQISCFEGTDGIIYANGNGGSFPYSYAWSNGDNTATISDLGVGFYQVTITDASGCTAVGGVNLNQPLALGASTNITRNYGGFHVSCIDVTDAEGVILAHSGTGPYTYEWSDGTIGDTIQDVGAGKYYVTTTDVNNCTRIDSITFLSPPPRSVNIILNNGIQCQGDSTASITAIPMGGSGNDTYLWSNGDNTANISNVPAGQYIVTVTDMTNCSVVDSITVIDVPEITISFNNTNPSCGVNDGSITATMTGGTSPYNYVWSNGGSSSNISDLAAGSYVVTVFDALGCMVIDSTFLTSPSPCLEVCNNGLDDDGDGLIDLDDPDCICCEAKAPSLLRLNKK